MYQMLKFMRDSTRHLEVLLFPLSLTTLTCQDIEADVQTAASELRASFPDLPIVVTGHSLGAALSVLCAAALASGILFSSFIVLLSKTEKPFLSGIMEIHELAIRFASQFIVWNLIPLSRHLQNTMKVFQLTSAG